MTLLILTTPLGWARHETSSEPPPIDDRPITLPAQVSVFDHEENVACLVCHSLTNMQGEFADGHVIPLYIDVAALERSVHGAAGLACTDCHTTISSYPHHDQQSSCIQCHTFGETTETRESVELPFVDSRAMRITINDACRNCHEQEFELAQESIHARAQQAGNREAPLCVDCHGGHDVSQPDNPRNKIPATCGQCHRAVYSTYRSSVHGDALEEASNPDVPSCIDCHGVHSVRGPRSPQFHNDSITICGSCHNNQALMDQYDISTDVFTTYLNDFHGRTVDLFRRDAAGASDKAVCFDCHGIHNIRRPEDPMSTVYPDNLQSTCQQCHQEANIRFPDAWLSHYVPSWEDTPALFVADHFYQILVPVTLGLFVSYVGLDMGKQWRLKWRQRALSAEVHDE